MKGVFYFDFYFDDDSSKTCAFILNEKAIAAIGTTFHLDDGWFFDEISHIEEVFGVHDGYGFSDERVVGIGFSSYEIDKKHYFKCMQLWRDVFINRVGNNVSDIVIFNKPIDKSNDWDIFKLVEQLTYGYC